MGGGSGVPGSEGYLDMTWTCHICGDERPDEFISVRQHETTVGGLSVQQNVRYCNDRVACTIDAETFRFMPEDP